MKKVLAILLTVIMIYPACGLPSFAEGEFIFVEPLPTEDGDALSDGDFWFDADGWLDSLEVFEVNGYRIGENTEYYLEDDGNTITVITAGDGPGENNSIYYGFRDGVIPTDRVVTDDQLIPAFIFDYLCRHGETGPRWSWLPLADGDWLENGDYYFDLEAFKEGTAPTEAEVGSIQDVSWYISTDGRRLRTFMRDDGALDITDLLPDDEDAAVFFAYVRQHGVAFVCPHLQTDPVGTVPVCKGQWLDVSGADPLYGTYTYAVCRQCAKILIYNGDELDAAVSIAELAALGIVPMVSLSHPDGDGDGVCDACGAYKLTDEISCGRYWLTVPQADAPYKSKAVIWGAEQDGTTCFELYLENMLLQPEDEEYAILLRWISQPAGHDFDDTIAANVSIIQAPTCTAPGSKDVKCSRCDATKSVQIPQTGHAYGKWTKLNGTYHQRVCANDATHVEKAKHTWQRTEYIKDASGAVVGKRYVCADCGAKKTVALTIDDSVDTPEVPEEEGTTAEAPEEEGATAEAPEQEGATAEAPEEERTTAEAPEEEGETIPEEEGETVPDEEATTVPDEEATTVPDEEATMVPDEEVTMVPDEEITTVPDEEVTTVPDEEITTVPDEEGTTEVAPDQPINTEPLAHMDKEKREKFVGDDTGIPSDLFAVAVVQEKSYLKIMTKTTGKHFKAGVTIFDANGNELSGDQMLGTGAIITGESGTEYPVVVLGDTDGDGKVGAADARRALRSAAKIELLSGLFERAADMDGDAKVKAGDARTILRIAARLEVVTKEMLEAGVDAAVETNKAQNAAQTLCDERFRRRIQPVTGSV